jgi:ATP-dependent exoDNAse (exonuclease V) beta subunit
MSVSSDLILYRASAGSGKTYTLAKEYLKIVIRNPYDYNKILAVTFTRKATEEMKTRIIEYLSMLEKKEKKADALRNAIIREVNESKGEDISEHFDKNVSTALQLILHDYSNFNISTIDSFFQGIIRSFAKELDLPIGMEVELDTDSVIQQAVQSMLKEYKTDKDAFSKWIEEYLFDLIEEDKSWKIERHISRLAKQILSEEYQLLAQNMQQFDIETYKHVLTELKQVVFDYRKKLNDLTIEVHRKIETDNLDMSLFFQGTKSVQSFINKTKEYAPEANSYLQKMLSGGDLYSKSKLKDSALIGQLENAWNNYLIYYINEVLEHRDKFHKRYSSADIVLKNIYALALLEFINAKIKQYKAEENLILISDTNQIISLIAQHEEVPFIFEKSANFLKYILVDEFQDTSSLQWKGMLPLLLEILQSINGVVLIVGDPKQSIYRWRGGKMELIMDGIEPDMTYHWKERKGIALKENYRSAKAVVQFNNAFFSVLKNTIHLQNPFFQKVLEDVEQNIIKTDANGYVEVKWLPKKSAEEEEDPQLQEVLQTIRSVYPARPYSDVAILTRNNMHGAEVANFLQDNHIPVVSAESLLLYNKLSVKLIIAALEYVMHPAEDFYCVKLNYLFAKYSGKEPLESYLEKKGGEDYFFEKEIPALQRRNIPALSSVALGELVFQLVHEMKLDIHLDNYLLRFQDIVLQYTQRQSNSVRDFLEYWNEQKQKLCIIPPDGIDAVKIYTIHKSKGLQFPIVILPYASWSMRPKPDSTIWLKSQESPFDKLHAFPVEMSKRIEESFFSEEYGRELESTYMDNINLLYVAFSRAEEQLYIFSTAEKEPKPDPLPSNVCRLLHTIIDNIELPDAVSELNKFSFGTKDFSPRDSKECASPENIHPAPFFNFKEKIKLAAKKEYNLAQVKGNILHTVLSKVYQTTHLPKAIGSTIATEEIDTYKAAAENIVKLFEGNNWFDIKWSHINERAIWHNKKQLRPDKVLLSDTECIIIDYKTGAKSKENNRQMEEYMEAYKKLFPGNLKMSAFLVYIDVDDEGVSTESI